MEINNSNSTGDGQTIPTEFTEPDGMKIARIVIEIFIGIFGVGGNMLVCVSIMTSKSLQNIGNTFIFSLSIADMGVLLICLPLVILNADFTFSWPFGDIGCKILLPMTDIFYGVSIGSIVGVSFHRYRMIVHCMRNQLTARKARLMVALIWLSSYVLFVLPLHFVVQLKKKDETKVCVSVWEPPALRQLHIVFVTLLFYILPLVVILGTYLRIRRKLSGDSFLHSQILQDPTSTVKLRLEQNKKALKILTPVVYAFALLMFPINALRLAHTFSKDLPSKFPYLRLVYNISVLLLLANSSINCIIYGIVNKDFRKEFRRILCCSFFKRIYTPISTPRRRFYSLYSTSKTVEEMLSDDEKMTRV